MAVRPVAPLHDEVEAVPFALSARVQRDHDGLLFFIYTPRAYKRLSCDKVVIHYVDEVHLREVRTQGLSKTKRTLDR